jgi:hypothetical protein
LIKNFWLAGNAEISDLGRVRDFRFTPFKKFWIRAPLGAGTLGPKIYMSDFYNMGVDLG